VRPARFQQILLDAASTIPGVTVKTLANADHTRHPYGIVVEAGGKTSRWQVVAVSPGDDYSKPEREPITGERLPEQPIPAVTDDPGTVEAALVAAVLRADIGEFSRVEPYTEREPQPAVGYGAAFELHSGAKVYINAIH
jgi:hypothetical protein